MRNPLFKKLPGCLLGALIAAGVAQTAMVHAVDGNPPGLFELDGNVTDEPYSASKPYTVGDDWESLFTGTESGVYGKPIAITNDENPASPTFNTLVVSDPAPKSIFTQGGSKDVNDVSAWKYTDGAVPDKDDITHAYAAAYINPEDTGPHKKGDMIIYFGLDRYANNGDANAGFWFFQNSVRMGGKGIFVDENGNPATHVAKRKDPDDPSKYLPGDLFVIVKYPQAAGADPLIKIYQWDPADVDGNGNPDPSEKGGSFSPLELVFSSEHAKCDQAGNKLACAITNLSGLNAPVWGYTPKSGTGLPFESFFEGGINVTELLGGSPCFASFLAETRSSESQTAQLKDLVLAGFPVCGIGVTKACQAKLVDKGTNVEVTFNGDVKNKGGSGYTAYLKDDKVGSSIDKVCIDTGAIGCGDEPAGNLIAITAKDGGAYFFLPAGTTYHYEGKYTTAGLPTTLTQSDTVTAQAFSKPEDVGVADPLVEGEATAKCDYGFSAKLSVTKSCTLPFVGGTETTLSVSGTVTNQGDVPLKMSLSDDPALSKLEFDPPLANGVLAAGDTASYKGTLASVAYSSVITDITADEDASDEISARTVTISHKDTVTATGKVIASDGTTVLGETSDAESYTCGDSFTSKIQILKQCDGVEVVELGGKVVVKTKVKATVNNLGQEDLNISSLLDDPALEGGFSGAASLLKPGGSTTGTGYYYPSKEDSGNTDPSAATFTDTATVQAKGVISSATLDANSKVTCDLCK